MDADILYQQRMQCNKCTRTDIFVIANSGFEKSVILYKIVDIYVKQIPF